MKQLWTKQTKRDIGTEILLHTNTSGVLIQLKGPGLQTILAYFIRTLIKTLAILYQSLFFVLAVSNMPLKACTNISIQGLQLAYLSWVRQM